MPVRLILPLLALGCSDRSSDRPDPTGPAPTAPTPTPTDTRPTPTSPALVFDGARPTNLLLVTLDTARADRSGRYGGSRTPALDAFLAEAVALDRHRSCSNWTGPSMSCLVSGRTPAAAGFWPLTDTGLPASPPPDWETLPGLLSDAGYSTRLLSANPLYGTEPSLGAIARGYDEVDVLDWLEAPGLAAAASEAASALLAVPNRPWMLHVHFADPHGPYCPPLELVDTEGLPPFEPDVCEDFFETRESYWDMSAEWQAAYTAWTVAYYDAEMEAWDQAFGLLLDELDELGALDDTLVVFATDHGEQLGERNAFGHGILTGPEETRAIAAFWAKNLAPLAFEGTTWHPDLAATLFDLYGLAPAAAPEGVVLGTAAPDRAVPIFNVGSGIGAEGLAENWGGTAEAYLSVVQGDVQLDYDWDGGRALYRLDVDPGAEVDVYDPADPDVVALWPELEALIAKVSTAFPELGDPIDPAP